MFSHEVVAKWRWYRDSRDYEWRAASRYKAVADKLFEMGLQDTHTVMDIGAGTCFFGLYLRQRGWRGLYIPVDAVIDGTDLDVWLPPQGVADFIVSIEVVEHLVSAGHKLACMTRAARFGVAITTPNADALDVRALDATHFSPVDGGMLRGLGFEVEPRSWMGIQDDTLFAWKGCE